MQRLTSKLSIHRAIIYTRIRLNTGFPTIHNKSSIFYAKESCKYSIFNAQRFQQFKYKSTASLSDVYVTNEKIHKLRNVKDVISLYVLSKEKYEYLNPLLTLDAITKCARKSVKESVTLLQDPDIIKKFNVLLEDIEVFLDNSPQSAANVLCSLAEITARQKTYFVKTGIEIYPNYVAHCSNDVTQFKQSHLTETVKRLFLHYNDVVLSNDVGSKELVNILWCFAETRVGNKELFEEIKNRILEEPIKDFTLQEIAHIVNCFAKLYSTVDESTVFIQMKNELLNGGFVHLNAQEIANLLFSFAFIKHKDPKLYKELINDILSRDIRTFNPPQLCKILWSCSWVNHNHDRNLSNLFNQLEGEILRRGVKRFDNRGLAVVTWSFVETENFSKSLFTLLRNEITRRNVRYFDPDDVTIVLKAFAKIKNLIFVKKLFGKFDKELVHRRFALFSNHHLATVLWSYAVTGNGSHALYYQIKKEIIDRDIQDFNATEFSQVIWSLARLRKKINVRDIFMFLQYDLCKLSLRQLALIGWSYAVTDVMNVKLWTDLINEITKKDFNKATIPVLCQLMYAFATFKCLAPPTGIIELIEKGIVENGAKSFSNRQLAVLIWSFGELYELCKSSNIYNVLAKETCSRCSLEYMPSDVCRILWGFAQVKHLINATFIFHSLTKELLKRELWEFSVAQITMATVAISTANQWSSESLRLFKKEITVCRNSRHFDGIHLCSLAKCLSTIDPLEVNDFFIWLEEEIIDRNASNLLPKELEEILRVLVNRKLTSIHFYKNVKEQLLTSSLDNYDIEEIRKVSVLLARVGVDVQELLMKSKNVH